MPPARRNNPLFAERLKFLREQKGLTQQQVVDLLVAYGAKPITTSAYSEYERCVSAPSRSTLVALEQLYGEPEGELRGLLGDSEGDRLTELEAEIGAQGELLRKIAAHLGLDDQR